MSETTTQGAPPPLTSLAVACESDGKCQAAFPSYLTYREAWQAAYDSGWRCDLSGVRHCPACVAERQPIVTLWLPPAEIAAYLERKTPPPADLRAVRAQVVMVPRGVPPEPLPAAAAPVPEPALPPLPSPAVVTPVPPTSEPSVSCGAIAASTVLALPSPAVPQTIAGLALEKAKEDALARFHKEHDQQDAAETRTLPAADAEPTELVPAVTDEEARR